MKEMIKRSIKNSRLLGFLYEPLHIIYKLWAAPLRQRRLRRNGPEVIRDLATIFNKYQIPAFAAYGTMLGFVREQGFIPHDGDIDIGVLPGEWTPQRLLHVLLEQESGFNVIMILKFRDKVTEFKVIYKDIPIDFFFYREEGGEFLSPIYYYNPLVEYPSVNANSIKIVHAPLFSSIVKTEVFGIEFPIVSNYKDVLAALYGDGWVTPDKKWNDDKRPHIVAIEEFGYSISLNEAFALEL